MNGVSYHRYSLIALDAFSYKNSRFSKPNGIQIYFRERIYAFLGSDLISSSDNSGGRPIADMPTSNTLLFIELLHNLDYILIDK